MLKLKRADYSGSYHGFTLKEGFYYGIDTDTNQYITTSGWECNGAVAIYSLVDGNQEMDWRSIEETDFHLENLPEVNTENKMSFVEWLEKEQGIDWNDFDENYSEISARQIEDEYNYYLYDGLPQFVRKQI